MRDLDTVFGQLPAHLEVSRNFPGISPFPHQATQRAEGHQRGRAHRVCRFFVRLVVIARQHSAARLVRRSRRFARPIFACDRRETIWFVAEKDVRDFFHQGGPISLWAMRRIQNHQAPTVWQWPRTRAA